MNSSEHPLNIVPDPAALATDLVIARPEGLYCPPAIFISIHGGRSNVPSLRMLIPIMRGSGIGITLHRKPGANVLLSRLPGITLQTLAYGERLAIEDTVVSLHPAGHVLGSSQVRIEHEGRVWVASGDYKLDPDPTCDAVRAGTLRYVHHRIDVRLADLPMGRAARRIRRHRFMVAS